MKQKVYACHFSGRFHSQPKRLAKYINNDHVFYCLRYITIAGSGAVALAHLDGSEMDEAVCTMIQRVQELALGYPEGRIELQLVGGFTDAHHYSEELFYNIMSK